MNYYKEIVKVIHLHKKLLSFMALSYLVIFFFWSVTLVDASQNFYSFLFEISQGKVFVTIIILFQCLALKIIFVDPNTFIRIRKTQQQIFKQNMLTLATLTAMTTVLSIATAACIFLWRTVEVMGSGKEIFITACIDMMILFSSLLVVSIVYICLTFLMKNNIIPLILIWSFLNISVYFPIDLLEKGIYFFLYSEKEIRGVYSLIGKTMILIGEALIGYMAGYVLWMRKEFLMRNDKNEKI